VDARLVLEAPVHADIDLGRQAITTGIDQCADDVEKRESMSG
jgi:hypothetical protein